MYFREKIFPLANEKVLAITLFEENLIHLFPTKDTFNQGYAYIMDVHTQKKENVLSLCSRTIAPNPKKVAENTRFAKHNASKSEREKYALYAEIEKETGVAYPVDALVARNGLAILTFRQDHDYIFRTVDLLHGKTLAEETVDMRDNRWMALNEAGTYGVRKRNVTMEAQSIQPVQYPLADLESRIESLMESMMQSKEGMEELMEGISSPRKFATRLVQQIIQSSQEKCDADKLLEAIVQILQMHKPKRVKQTNPHLQMVALKDNSVVAELEGNPLTHRMISYRDQWILFKKGSLVLYNAEGKKIKEYPIKSQFEPFCINVNHQKGLCMVLLGNGEVMMVDLVHDTQQKIRPHKGLISSHSVMEGVLNSSGTQLATLASNNDVMLTQLDTAKPLSTLVETLTTTSTPLVLDGKYTSYMRPGLVFIEDALILLAGGKCRTLNISEQQLPQQEEPFEMTFDGMPTSQQLKEVATKAGLGNVAEKLVEYYTPMVICQAQPNTEKTQAGTSHFGGQPDLADESFWPKWQKRPMQFIGQFNLEQVAKKVPDSDLPKTGLLSLFIAVDEEGMMIYPGEDIKGNEWKVIYQKDLTGLRTITQYSFEYPINFCAIDFQELRRLPQDDSILIQTLQLTNEEMAVYQELMQLINQDDETYETTSSNARNALRGHPLTFQDNDLELSCEMCRQLGSYYDYPQDSETLNKLKNDAKDLRLLFQLMDDEKIDLGLVEFYYYFFISKDDLQNENFDRVWLNGQC